MMEELCGTGEDFFLRAAYPYCSSQTERERERESLRMTIFLSSILFFFVTQYHRLHTYSVFFPTLLCFYSESIERRGRGNEMERKTVVHTYIALSYSRVFISQVLSLLSL